MLQTSATLATINLLFWKMRYVLPNFSISKVKLTALPPKEISTKNTLPSCIPSFCLKAWLTGEARFPSNSDTIYTLTSETKPVSKHNSVHKTLKRHYTPNPDSSFEIQGVLLATQHCAIDWYRYEGPETQQLITGAVICYRYGRPQKLNQRMERRVSLNLISTLPRVTTDWISSGRLCLARAKRMKSWLQPVKDRRSKSHKNKTKTRLIESRVQNTP